MSADYRLLVRVKTKARQEGICGRVGDRIKIAVNEAPEKGKANKRLCAVVADFLGCAPARVSVVAGMANRDKTLLVEGIPGQEIEEKIAAYAADME